MNSRNLFGTLFCAISALAASSAAALGQNDPAACRLLAGNADHSPPSFSETMADPSPSAGCCELGCGPSCCCPRWTASADFIILDRIGGTNQTLVESQGRDSLKTAGTVVLTGNDFRQGFAGGPRVGLICHGDDGCELELSCFQIGGWSSDRTVMPADPDNEWLAMRAPGGFLQTNQRSRPRDGMGLYDATL